MNEFFIKTKNRKIQTGINQDLNISSKVDDNHIAILNRRNRNQGGIHSCAIGLKIYKGITEFSTFELDHIEHQWYSHPSQITLLYKLEK